MTTENMERKMAEFRAMSEFDLREILNKQLVGPTKRAMIHRILGEREEENESEKSQAHHRTAIWVAAAALGILFISVIEIFLRSG